MQLSDDDKTLAITGPERYVRAAQEATHALIRQHAKKEEAMSMSSDEVVLVGLVSKRSARASFEGVDVLLQRNDGKVILKGTEERVVNARHVIDQLLADAEGSAVQLPLNGAQLDRLLRSGRDRESLCRKLQEAHECAVVADRSTMMLSLRGRADAVALVQEALEVELDVDEHVRELEDPQLMIPVIIGKGGATIKRLQADSGTTFDLDRTTGRLRVFGPKTSVEKAVLLLDDLIEQYGTTVSMPVQNRQIALIIGKGGQQIRQLQADSGANVEILKDDCKVRIRGNKEAVERAVEAVNALLSSSTHVNGASGNAGRPRPSGPPPGLRAPAGPPPGLSQ